MRKLRDRIRAAALLLFGVSLAVIAPACRSDDAVDSARLVVERRLIAADGKAFKAGLVRDCEIDAESRPALGCTSREVVTVRDVVVSSQAWRAELRTPEPARGAPAVIDARLVRCASGAEPRLVPLRLVEQRLGEVVDLEMPLPEQAVGERCDLEVRFRPVPPPDQVFESKSLDVPRGAVLQVALGLDPVVRWIPASKVAFEIDALGEDGETTPLLRTELDPGEPRDQGWIEKRVSLDALAGRKARMLFRTRGLATPASAASAPVAFPLWANGSILVGPLPTARNVILISLDTLRPDFLGTYGSPLPTSPGIDVLAAQGAVFERIFTTWPSTTVAHMSMLTGLYPSVFVQRSEMKQPLSPGHSLLAERLGRAGFATAAVTENGYVTPRVGFMRGFDSYRENRGVGSAEARGEVARTFAEGLAWVRRHSDERFFLFLHTYQVHTPYDPPAEFDVFSVRGSGFLARQTDRATRDRGLYAGEVLYTDVELGKLVRGLDELGLLESTILVITADHGEAFGEHGLFGHANVLFDETMRVPLIVYAPGLVPAGVRVSAVGSLVDVVPTLLELAGLPLADDVSGRSLVPVLRDPTAPAGRDRVVFAENHKKHSGAIAVRSAERKWIFDLGRPAESAAYDLKSDPVEGLPLRDTPSLAVGQRAVREYNADTAALAERVRRAASAAPGEMPALDDDVAEKLRILGYVD